MTRTITTCALAALAAAPGALLAQQTEQAGAPLDQIIVTGARTPIESGRTGSAASIITREQIRERQARYLTDVLRTVPGFAISHTGVTGSQTQVRVRGSEANHVLVLIDGVRANDPATGDEFRWEHLSLHNVERIEVVRGAQSSLWGSDAVGAVVHVITRSDAPAAPRAEVYAEGGSNDTRNAGLSGTIGGRDWLISAGVEDLHTDGANISRTGTERDGSELTTLSVTGRLDTDRWRFTAGMRALDAASAFDPVDFFTTGLPADGDSVTESDNLFAHVGAAVETLNGRLTHRFNARYYDSKHRNLVDGEFDSSTASDRYRIGYQADVRLGEDLLSLAVEQEQTDFSQRGAVVFGDPNQDQDIETTSFVAEYQYLSGDRLSLLAGVRYDDNSDFEAALTGRFSFAYRLSDGARLRASVGRGHKNPTFTERFGFFPGQFIGNPDLEPERSTSYEVGIDQDLLGGALRLQVTAFHQDLEDEINGFVFDPATFLSTAENRPGDSERTGAELSAEWQAENGIRLAGSYTYVDASEEDDLGNSLREIRRPRHTGSISTGYRSDGGRFEALLVADYGGSRLDNFFPPFPQQPERVTLADYWLLDLTMQLHLTPRFTVFARGSNLLDDDYEQVFGYRTLRRTAFVGVRAQLGR